MNILGQFGIRDNVRIIHTSRRFETGLTPTITIKDRKDATVVSDTMTELSDGFYYYDYRPTRKGAYTVTTQSGSGSSLQIEKHTFEIIDKSNQISRAFRGGSGVIMREQVWTFEEKEALIGVLTKLAERFNINIDEIKDRITVISEDSRKLQDSLEDVRKRQQDLESRVKEIKFDNPEMQSKLDSVIALIDDFNLETLESEVKKQDKKLEELEDLLVKIVPDEQLEELKNQLGGEHEEEGD